MKSIRKKVALLVEVSNEYARELLSGIIAFEQGHADWSVYLPEQQRKGEVSIERLKDWKVDGILARIETESIAKAVKELNVPVVDLSAARLVEGIPWVETDNAAIAKMAADHLLEKGFQYFGFIGEAGFNWSRWREEEFRNYLSLSDIQCECFEFQLSTNPRFSWQTEIQRLRRWVTSLPKPTGVFASYDIAAHRLLEICREEGIPVPDQVAVVGVDNDDLICNICSPTLTSVEPAAFDSGFHAAKLLEQQMNGEVVSSEGVFFKPLSIKERLSTDTIAVDDPDVAGALWFIRENAVFNISVDDVVANGEISRRQLETRFKKIIGHSPHKEIQSRRLRKVKQLLASTDLSVAIIAERVGYEHAEYLSVVFQREEGISMSEFRKRHKQKRN